MPEESITVVHLNGPARGRTRRFNAQALDLGLGPTDELVVGAAGEIASPRRLAVLKHTTQGYRIDPLADTPLWINGRQVRGAADVRPNDLVEIGAARHAFRFRSGARRYKSLGEAMNDCVACANYGGRSTLDRAGLLGRHAPYEIATQVSPLWRAAAVVLVAGLVAVIATLWQQNVMLGSQLLDQRAQIEGLAAQFERAEAATLTADEVRQEREQLHEFLAQAARRVDALAGGSAARARTIAEAAASVVFLQGSYGFRDPHSDLTIRTRSTADGSTLLSVDPDDPPLEIRYTGTGFLVSAADGLIATNRHVALPWEFDEVAIELVRAGLIGEKRRLVGYFPDEVVSFGMEVLRTHETLDVALLSCEVGEHTVPALRLSDRVPRAGEEVIVLGYPTGMRALLARADPALTESLLATGPVDFWDLAGRLAAAGAIGPLATVGFVGQTTSTAIVYDAETTHGGSGGPVLTVDGLVVAINSAILPEFGGSNLGVPSAALLKLLTAEDLRQLPERPEPSRE